MTYFPGFTQAMATLLRGKASDALAGAYGHHAGPTREHLIALAALLHQKALELEGTEVDRRQ